MRAKRLLDTPNLLEHARDRRELPRRSGREGARPAQAVALQVGDDVVGEPLRTADRLRGVRGSLPARRLDPLRLGGSLRRRQPLKAPLKVLSGERRRGQPCCSRKA
jgi:hypothetical protein